MGNGWIGVADRALEFARFLAAQSSGELLAIHCIEFTLPGKGPGGRYPIYANEDELQEKVRRQIDDLSRDGVRASLRVERTDVGRAAHVIADAAKDAQAEVIVLGTLGAAR